MEDITPEIIERIRTDYKSRIAISPIIRSLSKKIKEGTATYNDAMRYAREIGNIRVKVLKNNLSSSMLPDGHMYYNIAKDVFNDSLSTDYKQIQPICDVAQANKNKKMKIGLKNIVEDIDQENIDNIINMVDATEQYDDKAELIEMACATFSKTVVDRNMKANADFQSRAGLRIVIERIAGAGCCEYCSDLAGSYAIGDAPDEVWGHHNGCTCTVDYLKR